MFVEQWVGRISEPEHAGYAWDMISGELNTPGNVQMLFFYL
jgi:hypothetical protein